MEDKEHQILDLLEEEEVHHVVVLMVQEILKVDQEEQDQQIQFQEVQ